jgi:hypothetical protein
MSIVYNSSLLIMHINDSVGIARLPNSRRLDSISIVDGGSDAGILGSNNIVDA